jgi:hypothetical protein
MAPRVATGESPVAHTLSAKTGDTPRRVATGESPVAHTRDDVQVLERPRVATGESPVAHTLSAKTGDTPRRVATGESPVAHTRDDVQVLERPRVATGESPVAHTLSAKIPDIPRRVATGESPIGHTASPVVPVANRRETSSRRIESGKTGDTAENARPWPVGAIWAKGDSDAILPPLRSSTGSGGPLAHYRRRSRWTSCPVGGVDSLRSRHF